MSSIVARCHLRVDQLEELALPAIAWPFAGGLDSNPLVGTWAQYQDVKNGVTDIGVHMHEGLDIAGVAPNDVVTAVDDGFVLDIVQPKAAFFSAVVVADGTRNAFNAATTKKWTYLHVIPDVKIRIDMEVKKGVTVIGKVAEFPERTESYPNHLHLNRGIGADQAYGIGRSGRKLQPIPNRNPLAEFPPALDALAPTIGDIKFRIAEEDRVLGAHQSTAGGPSEQEKIRTNVNYLTGSTKVKLVDVQIIGKLAANGSALLDLLIDAYDKFGAATAAPAAKLNPATFQFDIKGKAFGGHVQNIAGFNFSAISDTIDSYKYFTHFRRTRSVYANDSKADSGFSGPFWYLLSNTASQSSVFGAGGSFPVDGHKYYWNSKAKSGQAWNVPDTDAVRAKRNSEAEYPDDVYDVKVTVKDLSGNSKDKTVQVLLDNWKQSIVVSTPGSIRTGGDIVIASGEQFRAGKTVNFYLVPFNNAQTTLPNGTALANKIGSVVVDANGEFKNVKLQGVAPNAGDYWLVADSNDDAEFTGQLDATIKITVKAAKAPNPLATLSDGYFWNRGWTLEVGAPGVVDNDEAPNWSNATVQLVSTGPQGSVVLRPDGSFSYLFNAGSNGTGWFTYRVTSNGATSAETSVYVTPTNESPVGESDVYVVPHGGSIHRTGIDGVLANDHDWDLDTLTVSVSSAAQHGSLVVSSNGGFDYVPSAGFVGAETFSYVVTDGLATSPTVWVTVDVTNNAPTAAEDVFGISPGQTLSVPFASGVRINDADVDGDPMSTAISIPATRGNLVLSSNGSFTYSPTTSFVGYDSFEYSVGDGFDSSGSTYASILSTRGCLVGHDVWNDLDSDGIQDYGELNIPGVTVRLLNSGGSTVYESMTDQYGVYLFDATPGTYRLQVLIPSGTTVTSKDVSSDDGIDSDFSSTGYSDFFTVSAGTERYNLDLGLRYVVQPSALLGGRVWVDSNGDGIKDAAEVGRAGVVVSLVDINGVLIATTTSAADGTYSFANVAPGNYRMKFGLPSTFTFSNPDQGADAIDSDVTDFANGLTDVFAFLGGNKLDIWAGLTSGGGTE